MGGALAASLAVVFGHAASSWGQWLGAMLLGLGLAWTTVQIPSLALKIVVAAIALLETAVFSWLLQWGGIQWPPHVALAAGALATGFGLVYSLSKAGRRRRMVAEICAGRTSRATFQQFLESDAPFPFAGEKREASLVECQLLNSRERASQLSAPDFVALSNAFCADAAQVLRDAGGVLAGSSGVAPRALFGALLAEPAHAAHASEAARALEERLRVFRPECLERWGVEPDCRVSVHSGPMIVGVFGSVFDVAPAGE